MGAKVRRKALICSFWYESAVQMMVKRTAEEVRAINILVNNAGRILAYVGKRQQ